MFVGVTASAVNTAYSKTELYPETVSNLTDILNVFFEHKKKLQKTKRNSCIQEIIGECFNFRQIALKIL
jgi:hypothetical protein